MQETTDNAVIDADLQRLEMMFMITYNPSNQIRYTKDEERCVYGRAPALVNINKQFSKNTAQQWLTAQIDDLANFLDCKPPTAEQRINIADMILDRYYYLKVTELMLFFKKLKFGDYCKFYDKISSVDLLSSLHDFVTYYRTGIIRRHNDKELEAEYKKEKENFISRKNYLLLKQLKNGTD